MEWFAITLSSSSRITTLAYTFLFSLATLPSNWIAGPRNTFLTSCLSRNSNRLVKTDHLSQHSLQISSRTFWFPLKPFFFQPSSGSFLTSEHIPFFDTPKARMEKVSRLPWLHHWCPKWRRWHCRQSPQCYWWCWNFPCSQLLRKGERKNTGQTAC